MADKVIEYTNAFSRCLVAKNEICTLNKELATLLRGGGQKNLLEDPFDPETFLQFLKRHLEDFIIARNEMQVAWSDIGAERTPALRSPGELFGDAIKMTSPDIR